MAGHNRASFLAFFIFLISGISSRLLTQTSEPVPDHFNFSCDFQGQFPYMASLRDDFGNYRCGATLISDAAVLTAASCVDPILQDNIGISEVFLGGQDREVPVQRRPVTAVYPHESYTGDPREGNDIAIVRFSGGTCMKPIPFLGGIPFPGETYLILGYGQTGPFEPLAGGLLGGNQTNFEIAECNADGIDPPLDEGRICTQAPDCNCPSICSGDEGGPLVRIETIARFEDTLMGVISYGTSFCGEGDGYSVYTNVLFHRDWILNALQTS